MIVHVLCPLTDLKIYENILCLHIAKCPIHKLTNLKEYFVILALVDPNLEYCFSVFSSFNYYAPVLSLQSFLIVKKKNKLLDNNKCTQ